MYYTYVYMCVVWLITLYICKHKKYIYIYPLQLFGYMILSICSNQVNTPGLSDREKTTLPNNAVSTTLPVPTTTHPLERDSSTTTLLVKTTLNPFKSSSSKTTATGQLTTPSSEITETHSTITDSDTTSSSLLNSTTVEPMNFTSSLVNTLVNYIIGI